MKTIVLTDKGLGVIETPEKAAMKNIVYFKDQEGTMKDCYNLFDLPYIEQGKLYPVPEGYEIKEGYACELKFPCECKFPEDHGKECQHRYAILVPTQEPIDLTKNPELLHSYGQLYPKQEPNFNDLFPNPYISSPVAPDITQRKKTTSIEEAANNHFKDTKFGRYSIRELAIREFIAGAKSQEPIINLLLDHLDKVVNGKGCQTDGCPMCDYGKLRNPEKEHWDDCAWNNAKKLLEQFKVEKKWKLR